MMIHSLIFEIGQFSSNLLGNYEKKLIPLLETYDHLKQDTLSILQKYMVSMYHFIFIVLILIKV